MADAELTPPNENPGERVRIPVNAPAPDKKPDDIDSLVREYESKYYDFRESESARVKDSAASRTIKPKRQVFTHSGAVSEEERMWAAIAHGSALLTLFIGLLTGGLAVLLTLLIPLGIYIAYRQRSEYVAYAALQALALQVLGTVGWVAILIVGVLAGALLSVLLAITLIGIILVPFVLLAIALFVLASFALPLGMVVFGAIAAWETYQGKSYRYPWVGDWIDRQLHTGFLVTL